MAALRALAGPGSLQLSLAGAQGAFVAGARALMHAWQQERFIVHHSQALGACKHNWFFEIKSPSLPVCCFQIGRYLPHCGLAATILHHLCGHLLDSLQYVISPLSWELINSSLNLFVLVLYDPARGWHLSMCHVHHELLLWLPVQK